MATALEIIKENNAILHQLEQYRHTLYSQAQHEGILEEMQRIITCNKDLHDLHPNKPVDQLEITIESRLHFV